jgi:membrane protein required for colicin V production
LNWIDFLILAVFAWFTYSAFQAGMIREVVTIAGAIFAVALAGLFYQDLAKDVEVAVDNPETAKIIAFAMIFGSVILASQLTAMFLKQAATVLMLGLFDSLGGAFIGIFKAFVFIEIALIFAITFPSLHLEDDVGNSAFAPLFLDVMPILKAILPAEFKNAIDAF